MPARKGSLDAGGPHFQLAGDEGAVFELDPLRGDGGDAAAGQHIYPEAAQQAGHPGRERFGSGSDRQLFECIAGKPTLKVPYPVAATR